MAGLSLRHVCKVYEGKDKKSLFRKKQDDGKKRTGDFLAVDDFNMEIEDGEFVVFVGPSGCGKSTTLRMIAGLEEITSGELYIGDKLVNNVEPKDRDIAMVFQSYALFPHMTAFQNIAFGLQMRKVPVNVLNPHAKELVSELNKQRSAVNAELKKLNKQLKDYDKALKAAKKSGADVEEIENSIAAKKSEVEAKQAEIAAINAKRDEVITKAEPVLKIDNRKIRALKSELKEAKDDLKYCETDEETANVNARIESINKDIEYYVSTSVPAFVFRHIPKDVIREKVNRAAKILEIEELLDVKPRAMSGGQRQRIALGRAIVREPKVMLLDEPLSNLDAKLRASMRAEIVKLHNELKTTFIYVTHDQVEAMTMGTRIVVMKRGIVQQIDTPVNLFDYPANKFVAGFIGTPQMNFFDVTIKKTASKLSVKFVNGEEQRYDLSKLRQIDPAFLDGEEHNAILGVRGENISISEQGLTVTLSLKEILGNTTQMLVKLTDNGGDYVVCANERNDYKAGDVLHLAFAEKHIHLFDRQTEKTIMANEQR